GRSAGDHFSVAARGLQGILAVDPDARHMDAVRMACAKPLLLREAVKEAVASGRVEKLQPKELQTWKTTRRVGKSFANGWRFRRTSDRRQIRPRPSPKGLSSRTSFSAVAASRTTESWDGCCRASAGRDRSSRPIRLERFSPLGALFERYDFRVGGLSGLDGLSARLGAFMSRLAARSAAVTDRDDTRGSCRPATGCCVRIAGALRAWDQ